MAESQPSKLVMPVRSRSPAPLSRRRHVSGATAAAPKRGSSIVVRVCLETGLADLRDEPPGVGPRAVDVGESVLARKLTGVDGSLVPSRAVGIRCQRDDGPADVPR